MPGAHIYLVRSSLELRPLKEPAMSNSAESSIRCLNEKILTCMLCPLSKTRRKAVPGEGPTNAKMIFIGEGPGRQEDLEGRPFVGRAGKFLDECLQSIGLQREQVFITNIVKCRPTEKAGNWIKDRKPTAEEIAACNPYLDKQIELLKPEVICTLGDTARFQVFKRFGLEEDTIGHVHGRLFLSGNVRVVPLYHPAAALYDNSLRQIIMIDFQSLRRVLSQRQLTNL
jgi:uracil-DNA glycosylase family 4